MKFALVGVGGAGGRIVEQLSRLETKSNRSFSYGNLLAFDTTKAAFEQYSHIPLDRHVLVGDMHSDVQGEGVDGDVDLGVTVAKEDVDEIHREFDKLALHEVDAVLVVAGFGGGTGGGVGPVILEDLQSVSDNPVYVLGVLPHDDEGEPAARNAARSLQSFVRLADNTILFDNNAWHDGEEPIEESAAELNEQLAMRVLSILAVGELQSDEIAETLMDSSDLARTLETGGVSTIGYASRDLGGSGGLLARLLPWLGNGSDEEDTSTDAMKIQQLIKSAASSQLTLPCEISSAERGLIVLSGPPEVCSRKGFESGRYWLEQETDSVQVLAGDEPRPDSSTVSATVLLTNVTDVPRIEELKHRAVSRNPEH